MIDEDSMAAYRQRLAEVRATLSSKRRWTEMPHLLDDLERARCRVMARRPEQRQQAWIGRFVCAAQTRGASVGPERIERAAHELWPWLGWYDPEAVGAGCWDKLPRSHA